MINTKLISKFRKKFKSGDVCIGAWMQIPSTDIAEILSKKKFDWIALDLEHGNFNRETLTDIIRVISLSNIIPLVRVSNAVIEVVCPAVTVSKSVITVKLPNGCVSATEPSVLPNTRSLPETLTEL